MRWFSDVELLCAKGERCRVAFALDYCNKEIMIWVATIKALMLS
jgi:putative transposase